MSVNVFAAAPAPLSAGASDLASVVTPGRLHPNEQLGACTIKPGSRVLKAGVEYRVTSVTRAGVVGLSYLSRGFAMYSHKSVCVLAV